MIESSITTENGHHIVYADISHKPFMVAFDMGENGNDAAELSEAINDGDMASARVLSANAIEAWYNEDLPSFAGKKGMDILVDVASNN